MYSVVFVPVKPFVFSKHYREDKDIDVDLAKDCVHHGRKEAEKERGKFKSSKRFRKGELAVIYREFDEYYFVITAYWNVRGDKT